MLIAMIHQGTTKTIQNINQGAIPEIGLPVENSPVELLTRNSRERIANSPSGCNVDSYLIMALGTISTFYLLSYGFSDGETLI
jgi:hypothetical protein